MAIKRKLVCEKSEDREWKRKKESNFGDGVGWIRGPVLGQGSFGSVYKATVKSPVLFNIFPPELAVKSSESSNSSTLRQEREVMRQLKGCSSAIQCYGDETTIGDEGGVMAYNLLLEFCSGGTLADRIRELWRLPEDEVRVHTGSLLMGLVHIHDRGFIHCDLRPDNVLMVPREGGGFVAKIGDFGLSKKRNTKEGWRGTPLYLSPEAAAGCEQEAPADIWALGCVVLQMLTGKRPWEGRKSDILASIVSENRFPKIPEYISADARNFILCCFERHLGWSLSAKKLLGHSSVESSCEVSQELEEKESVTKSDQNDADFCCEYNDDWMYSSYKNSKIEDEGFGGSITTWQNPIVIPIVV